MLRTLTFAAFAAAAFAAVPLALENLPSGDEDPQVSQSRHVAADRLPEARSSGRKVRLSADASGHFTADFRFNGRNVPAMVDTGATVVALSRATARRIGVNVTESAFSTYAETANGRVRAASVTIGRLALGRIELRDVQAMVLDDRALPGTLVGMSFLSRLKRYSVEGGLLTLEQ